MKTQRRSNGTACVARAALICAWLGLACSPDGGRPGGLAAKGPTVGQSGSEGVPSSGGGATAPCPCGQRDAFRVTLLERRGDTVSLRIEEVLHGSLPLVPGVVIEGRRYDDTLACHLGCADIDVGEQAFAFYTPQEPALPACGARQACIEDCLAGSEEVHRSECSCRQPAIQSGTSVSRTPTCGFPVIGDWRSCEVNCERETAEICPPRPEQDYKTGTVGLSAWADPIVFARGDLGELSVPLAELAELLEYAGDGPGPPPYQVCIERFGQWSQYASYAGG